jgi:Sulfotransferase family
MWKTGVMEDRADPHASASAGSEKPKVIYVMGAGRSGSTILGVALGNCENVFFAGELNQWLTRSGNPTLGDPQRARFWDEVRRDVAVEPELFGGPASCLERSSALLRVGRWRARRRLRDGYRRASEDLYRAIARAADVTHIVDSSHYPLRARELRRLGGIDMYILFLVRDPQGIVASLDREDVPERRFGVWTANAYLWLTYLISTIVFLLQPRRRRLLVRHEDFIADPEAVLSRILRQAQSQAPPPDVRELRSGLPFHGNRLIRSERIAIERSAPKRSDRSLLTSVLQLPVSAAISLLRPATDAPPGNDQPDFGLDSADVPA